MPIARITDHVQAGLDLLLEQYKNKPRIAALLTSELDQIQNFEDAVWSVIVGRLIDNAVGVQLDALGKIVGQVRYTASDELYRPRIRARIRANRSLGHPDDIIAVVLLALNAEPGGGAMTYAEQYPASFVIELFGETEQEMADVISDLVFDTKPPGVGYSLSFSSFPESAAFTFADGDEPVDDADRGFTDDEDPTTAPGGRWIGTA